MRAFDTNYSGRQIDIEWLQTITRPALTSTQLNLSFSESTKIVTGIQKIAQRFTLIFLTNLGDIRFNQTYGTTFWQDALQGATQNMGQVTGAVNRAMAAAMRQMQDEDVNTETYGAIPNDDRIEDVELSDYSVDRNSGTLLLRIGLTSAAGEDYTYVLPVQAVRT